MSCTNVSNSIVKYLFCRNTSDVKVIGRTCFSKWTLHYVQSLWPLSHFLVIFCCLTVIVLLSYLIDEFWAYKNLGVFAQRLILHIAYLNLISISGFCSMRYLFSWRLEIPINCLLPACYFRRFVLFVSRIGNKNLQFYKGLQLQPDIPLSAVLTVFPHVYF